MYVALFASDYYFVEIRRGVREAGGREVIVKGGQLPCRLHCGQVPQAQRTPRPAPSAQKVVAQHQKAVDTPGVTGEGVHATPAVPDSDEGLLAARCDGEVFVGRDGRDAVLVLFAYKHQVQFSALQNKIKIK